MMILPCQRHADGLGFQVQDVGDAGQVDALIDEFGDPLEAFKIVVAVSAGSPVGARRGEQSPALVEPQGLRPDAGPDK
jgi:hypothetical protein